MTSAEKRKITIVYCLLIVLMIFLFMLSISTGSVMVPFSNVTSVLINGTGDNDTVMIIRMIRLPRTVLALVSGGALALAGYLLQTFFRNPIAGPYVMGISSGARMMVAIMTIIVLSRGGGVSSIQMVVVSFAGALLSTVVILLLSTRIKSMSVLLVAGIMISYICTAVTDFIVNVAGDSSVVNMHGWSQGSFSGTSEQEAAFAAVFILIVSMIVWAVSKPIGAYRNGEVYAKSVGVNVRALQISIILLSSLLSGIVTAFAGPVSFVGIAVPFIVRKLMTDRRPVIMMPAVFLTGASYTMAADLAARMLLSPTELSLSTVTAFAGVPIVLIMLAGGRFERKC